MLYLGFVLGFAPEAKAQILQRVRELTNLGRHLEASALFREHFPDGGPRVLAN